MPLADYTPETRAIPLASGKSFNVSGLSLSHLEILVRTHLPDIKELFSLFESGGNFDADGIKALCLTLATRAPGFVANVIALAAGETDATDKAARLPFPTQLLALTEIFEITFTEVGGIKKFMETVAALLSGMNLTVPSKLTDMTTRMTAESSGSTEVSAAM